MATVRKTITVTDQQDQWIASQVQAGRFTNDSELIRDLIRREQERNTEVESVRQALIEGGRSGEPQAFDFAAFTRRKRTQHKGRPARERVPTQPQELSLTPFRHGTTRGFFVDAHRLSSRRITAGLRRFPTADHAPSRIGSAHR